MTISKIAPPKYRRQRRTGRLDLAFVEVHRHRTYLGEWNSPASLCAYRRILSEFEANGGALPVDKLDLTLAELCDRFVTWAEQTWNHPAELQNWAAVTKLLSAADLYGDTLASDFDAARFNVLIDRWEKDTWQGRHRPHRWYS